MLKRKTPLKRGGPIKKRKKKKMSELTERQQEARREKWAFNRMLKEVDKLSRELALLYWGNNCKWPLCEPKNHNQGIQWHHFITRDVWSVRWDPFNLIPLHSGCHLYGIHGSHSHLGVDIMMGRLSQTGFEFFMRKKNNDTLPRTMETLVSMKEKLEEKIIIMGNSL